MKQLDHNLNYIYMKNSVNEMLLIKTRKILLISCVKAFNYKIDHNFLTSQTKSGRGEGLTTK